MRAQNAVARNSKIYASILLILAACLLPLGCATYQEPNLPEEEVGVVKTDGDEWRGFGFEGVKIVSVDGVLAGGFYPSKIAVLPGTHKFQIQYANTEDPFKFFTKYERRYIEFDVKKGHEYHIKATPEYIEKGFFLVEIGEVFLWVEDQKTGEIIAGKKPDWL